MLTVGVGDQRRILGRGCLFNVGLEPGVQLHSLRRWPRRRNNVRATAEQQLKLPCGEAMEPATTQSLLGAYFAREFDHSGLQAWTASPHLTTSQNPELVDPRPGPISDAFVKIKGI